MTVTEHPEELRGLLQSIAYRMVGSVGDAEDIVQEAFVRLHRARSAGTDVESPRAYLSAVTTRLAIDHLRSARVRRESYVGPWLPEPLVSDEGRGDPATHAEVADSLSLAFLVLLEQLTPTERAAFLLREVFSFGYDRIAEILERSEDGCRQLVARARRRIDERRPRFQVSRERHEELTERFLQACLTGDADGLVSLLAEDAAAYTDGGGRARAARLPVHGAEKVASFLIRITRPDRTPEGVTLERVDVNGQPGRLARGPDGEPIGVLVLDVDGSRVRTVRLIVNPEKLAHLRR